MYPTPDESIEMAEMAPRERAAMELAFAFGEWWEHVPGRGSPMDEDGIIEPDELWDAVERAYERWELLR